LTLIDTHAHLDDEQFAADEAAVLDRARQAGVETVLTIGTTRLSSVAAVRLAANYPVVRAVVGIQPNHVAQAASDDWAEIERLAAEARVVAIGETGLDRYGDYTPFEQQVAMFEQHIDLARRRDLPLVIHCRDAEAEVLQCLESASRVGPVRGVMHSFTGMAATALRCIELGFYISFAGMITFKNRKFDLLREVARAVPLDRLLVETDSPYLAPEPHRGGRNEPAYVVDTARRVAELRGVAVEEFAAITTANARRLFGRAP
jgi:TatD DNase family protein